MSESPLGWSDRAGDRLLEIARGLGLLSALDHRFASRLSELYGETSPGMRWALAVASRAEDTGHVCADLRRLESEGLSSELAESPSRYSVLAAHESLDAWVREIGESRLVEVVSSPLGERGEPRPLVLDPKHRLYLRRAFESQLGLVEHVRERAMRPDLELDSGRVEAGIERLVADAMDGDEAPALALRVAMRRPLSIVTGGPGTGKTTMVARLVALLAEQAAGAEAATPRVKLLAPTGKAAAAMTASFARQRESLDLDEATRAAMDVGAETLHRALHRQTRRDAFGRGIEFALAADLVVVDEASMVDLEMMARLFEACQEVPRLVLLGDPAQLASVDAGAVLSELCDASGPLADSVVTLRTSHRYAEAGGIGRLAEAIRAGDADSVIGLLDDASLPEIERCEIDSVGAVHGRLVDAVRSAHQEIEAAEALDRKLARMDRYRVLCAHRRGALGVETLCRVLDEATAAERRVARRAGWWRGRLVLVTQNSPDLDLWNGDVGLIEETDSGLRAVFPDAGGGVRSLTAGRLPSHESAIAMSVHKSQGSEFDAVDLVLGDKSSPIMTRELLYTGATRARTRLRIHASEALLREAVGRRVSRDSGLADLLGAT